MSIIFHALAGAAVAHVAVRSPNRLGRAPVERPALWVVAVAGVLAMLSHGVLDGLKHGYPLRPAADVCLGALLAAAWCAAVRRPLRLLFAVALAASFAPDAIDHTPPILHHHVSAAVPLNPLGAIFPWHWPEGSGSMDPGARHRCQDLNAGRNRAVSFANHAVVVALAVGGILTTPWAFRFVGPPDRPTSVPQDASGNLLGRA